MKGAHAGENSVLLACNIQMDRRRSTRGACAPPCVTRIRRREPRAALVAAATALCMLFAPRASGATPRTPVQVLVPEAGNLQLLAFYVALGAGCFERAGLDVTTVSPPSPALAQNKPLDFAGDRPG